MDVKNLCEKMVKTSIKSKDNDYLATIIRTISSGGDSSFTNKVGKNGMVNDYVYPNNNPTHLFARSLHLCKFMEDLDLSSDFKLNDDYKLPITVYRTVNFQSESADIVLAHPIPFSTSWNKNIAIDWLENTCCVFEIIVRFNSILPLSIPSEINNINVKNIAINQIQEELVLPPCRFQQLSEYVIENGENKVRVIVCEAHRLSVTEMIDFYPKKYKRELLQISNDATSGLINEKLLQYYEVEDDDEMEADEMEADEIIAWKFKDDEI